VVAVRLEIEIKGPADTLMLWSLIEKYKVNLTDIGEVIYIYGDTNITSAARIISCCALFGDLKIRLSKGGQ
jgi:hypothetical protein